MFNTKKRTHFVASPDGLNALDRLRAGSDGVHTSLDGKHYNNTVFGRDSSLVGDMLSTVTPEITSAAIMALAKLQGTKVDKTTNEEPGRIHHEYRTYKEWRANIFRKGFFKLIGRFWGGDNTGILTYFSMDSTPLYVLMVNDYAKEHPRVLQQTVIRQDGHEVTIEKTLEEAANWMMRQINDDGLVAVPRGNFFSLMHQTWKDSPSGYVDPDGRVLNIDEPIMYLEMQALVAEALQQTAHLLRRHVLFANSWRDAAAKIRKVTLTRFWQDKEQYFASAIHKGKQGEDVLIKTFDSDPGWLLATTLFDHLEKGEREKYVGGIVSRLFSKDFMTDAGVRARALRYKDALALVDYHGSYTVWPIDSYMLARGLRHQNLPLLADQLEARILDSINKAGNFYEYFFVDANNRVVYDPIAASTPFIRRDTLHVKVLAPAMMPESNIAWTVALSVRLRHDDQLPRKKEHQYPWQKRLERTILKEIKPFSLAHVLSEKQQFRPALPAVEIDKQRGQALFAQQIGVTLAASAARRLRAKLGGVILQSPDLDVKQKSV